MDAIKPYFLGIHSTKNKNYSAIWKSVNEDEAYFFRI